MKSSPGSCPPRPTRIPSAKIPSRQSKRGSLIYGKEKPVSSMISAMPMGSKMYTVHLTRKAQKDLLSLPKEDARRIRTTLNELALETEPWLLVKKLQGHEEVPLYSCRVGHYRIILT